MSKNKEITISIRIDSDMQNWLLVLEKKYNLKKGAFIRKAIYNELKREVTKLRLKKESQRNKSPF